MSDNLLEYRDLICPTDFKMLFFRPFIRLKAKKLFNALYKNIDLAKALVNVYPCSEGDSNDITNGHCFLVFENHKLANCIDDYKNVINHTGIKGVSSLSNKQYSVIVYKLPATYRPIANKYLNGNYKEMFNHNSLDACHKMFRCPTDKGLPMRIGKESSTYDVTLHILKFSEEYEKYRAADLGVPYEKYKGTTSQHKAPPDIEQERLSIKIINIQNETRIFKT